MSERSEQVKAINNLRLIKHSIKVAIFSYIMAKRMKLSKKQCWNILWAGLFHDIGKVRLDQNILNKKEKLTTTEFDHIKQHIALGVGLLKKYKIPEEIYKIVEQHHEHEDGTGYPMGLKENEICIEAKILRYADIYDALTSNRVYRKRYTKQMAMKILESEK